MIHLEHQDTIPSNVEQVYTLVRDHISDIAKFLPSVEKIEQINSTETETGKHEKENHWYANIQLPKLIAGYIPENLMRWKDFAYWDDNSKEVTYRLESFIGNQLFSAEGKNKFTHSKTANEMILSVSCEVKIHGDALPGIPKLLARKITPAIEKLIEKMLEPNITSLGTGIKSYLEDKQKKH